DRQLDALAEAGRRVGGAQSSPWVMAPMIATVDEAADFAERCRARGLTPGIMVEVPSVAVAVDRFLPHVDFLSIGTNDLTQYVMAADRMSSDLAALTDPWQPAVLRLIRSVAEAAGRAPGGRTVPVGVCGEAAADPHLACVLLGLGVSSLSVADAAVLARSGGARMIWPRTAFIVGWLPAWLAISAMALEMVIRVVVVGIIPGGRRPNTAMAWLLAIFLVPLIALPLFGVFGTNRLS